MSNTFFKWGIVSLCSGTSAAVNTKIWLIMFFAAKHEEALYSWQKQDLELTGSDHEFLIAKLKLKLKKVGKTIMSFRYELNQIPYDYSGSDK